jgi:hypothetical protein
MPRFLVSEQFHSLDDFKDAFQNQKEAVAAGLEYASDVDMNYILGSPHGMQILREYLYSTDKLKLGLSEDMLDLIREVCAMLCVHVFVQPCTGFTLHPTWFCSWWIDVYWKIDDYMEASTTIHRLKRLERIFLRFECLRADLSEVKFPVLLMYKTTFSKTKCSYASLVRNLSIQPTTPRHWGRVRVKEDGGDRGGGGAQATIVSRKMKLWAPSPSPPLVWKLDSAYSQFKENESAWSDTGCPPDLLDNGILFSPSFGLPIAIILLQMSSNPYFPAPLLLNAPPLPLPPSLLPRLQCHYKSQLHHQPYAARKEVMAYLKEHLFPNFNKSVYFAKLTGRYVDKYNWAIV